MNKTGAEGLRASEESGIVSALFLGAKKTHGLQFPVLKFPLKFFIRPFHPAWLPEQDEAASPGSGGGF